MEQEWSQVMLVELFVWLDQLMEVELDFVSNFMAVPVCLQIIMYYRHVKCYPMFVAILIISTVIHLKKTLFILKRMGFISAADLMMDMIVSL